jgi:hypothetical protein
MTFAAGGRRLVAASYKALTAAADARTAPGGNRDKLRRLGDLTREPGLEG